MNSSRTGQEPPPGNAKPAASGSAWRIEVGGPLIAVLALAACLRFWDLGQRALNEDEHWGLTEAQGGPAYVLCEQWKHDLHPPLNLLLLFYWGKLGDSDAHFRTPAALFSLLNAVILFLVVSELTGSAVSALISAWVFAISPFALSLARYAKGYALLGVLATVSVWALLRFCRRHSLKAGCVLAGVNAFGLYLHYSMALLVVAELVGYLAFFPDGRRGLGLRRWLTVQAGTLLLFLPWLYAFVGQVVFVVTGFGVGDAFKLIHPAIKAGYLLFAYGLGESVDVFNYPIVVPGLTAIGLAGITGLLGMWDRAAETRLFGTMPVLVYALAVVVLGAAPKHAYLAYPLCVVVLADGLGNLLRRMPAVGLLTLAVISGVSLWSSFNLLGGRELHFVSPPWKEVVQIMERSDAAQAPVFLYPEKESGVYRYSKMLGRYLPDLDSRLQAASLDADQAELASQVAALPADRLWAVLLSGGNERTEVNREFLKRALSEKYKVRAYYPLGIKKKILRPADAHGSREYPVLELLDLELR